MKLLQCPIGTEVLSHGDRYYFADSSHQVLVSDDDAQFFCHPPHNCEELSATQPEQPEAPQPFGSNLLSSHLQED